jgi:hypothetical protein
MRKDKTARRAAEQELTEAREALDALDPAHTEGTESDEFLRRNDRVWEAEKHVPWWRR